MSRKGKVLNIEQRAGARAGWEQTGMSEGSQ